MPKTLVRHIWILIDRSIDRDPDSLTICLRAQHSSFQYCNNCTHMLGCPDRIARRQNRTFETLIPPFLRDVLDLELTRGTWQ